MREQDPKAAVLVEAFGLILAALRERNFGTRSEDHKFCDLWDLWFRGFGV